ncbi:hypothetical protein AB0942_33355 [Streptomyces nodosus]|uniref:hypothetical protein n=1 Tax=Streptomyces nodosus TaxID=40318 RepID=UPI00345712BE
MSARDELFSIACQDMPVTPDEVNEAIDALSNEIAQELSDMIRTKAAKLAVFRSEEMRLTAKGLRMGADMIESGRQT